MNSFKDFDKKLESMTKKEKGDAFEYLTLFYLENDPIYKSKLKKVWLLNDVPPNILKKLNLPKNDMGIDLIAETNNNEFWAIQSKYRSHQDNLTWEELSTFIGLSSSSKKTTSFRAWMNLTLF